MILLGEEMGSGNASKRDRLGGDPRTRLIGGKRKFAQLINLKCTWSFIQLGLI